MIQTCLVAEQVLRQWLRRRIVRRTIQVERYQIVLKPVAVVVERQDQEALAVVVQVIKQTLCKGSRMVVPHSLMPAAVAAVAGVLVLALKVTAAGKVRVKVLTATAAVAEAWREAGVSLPVLLALRVVRLILSNTCPVECEIRTAALVGTVPLVRGMVSRKIYLKL
jgi:hypothetical protein